MKKICLVFFCLLFFISCEKQDSAFTKAPRKRVVKNRVLIILGEDYSNRLNILDYLKKDYFSEKESKIELFTYEEMLTNSGNIILRSIFQKIEKSNCDIVVALGAPAGSAKYLMQAQQKYPEKVYISLLPMEDILPLEAACDFVVDFKLPDTLMNAEETFTVSDEKVELLLVASVFAAEDILAKKKHLAVSTYEEFNLAIFTACYVLFSNNTNAPSFRVSPYIDPETSIPSRKYLIVYENSGDKPEQE